MEIDAQIAGKQHAHLDAEYKVRQLRTMAIEPFAEQWIAVDACILEGNILGALKQLRQSCSVSLDEAKDLHWSRYQRLRAERPLDFSCSHEEYWAGVYG